MSVKTDNNNSIMIPDFIVRQIGTLQLQLAAAQEQITELQDKLNTQNQTADDHRNHSK